MWEKTYLDFTEDGFLRLLNLLVENGYDTIFYGEKHSGKHVIWRHDVDCSVHQSLNLAQMEEKIGIKSTYFLMLNSPHYNLLELEIRNKIKAILDMGHKIALHFDMLFENEPIVGFDELSKQLRWQKMFLQDLFDCPIEAFSFHNPEDGNAAQYDQAIIEGMVNTYSAELKRDYVYMSDSNGIWRHKNIFEEISSNIHQRMHVLTHPVWWSPTPLPPRDRIKRVVDGRAKNTMDQYDLFLISCKRPNVGV